jgi:hypothetical protein
MKLMYDFKKNIWLTQCTPLLIPYSFKQKHHQPINVLSTYWGTGLLYVLHIRRPGHNPPREPSGGWCVLLTANATLTNSLTCLPKHAGVRDKKILVTHPITDRCCWNSAIARQNALIIEPSSSLSRYFTYLNLNV